MWHLFAIWFEIFKIDPIGGWTKVTFSFKVTLSVRCKREDFFFVSSKCVIKLKLYFFYEYSKWVNQSVVGFVFRCVFVQPRKKIIFHAVDFIFKQTNEQTKNAHNFLFS